MQHRTLCKALPYELQRKLLESILETYVAFAVRSRPEPVTDRLPLLLALARSGSPELHAEWQRYENELLNIILSVRSYHAGIETD